MPDSQIFVPISAADGERILLVEVDPHFSDLLARTLTPHAGFGEIVKSKTLAQALDNLRRSDFALIFLDLNLPDSRGLETLAKIQAEARNANVLVMTALMDEALGLQAMRMGAHDYFIKGRIPPDAMQRMARYANERRSSALALRKARDEMEIHLRHTQKMEAIGQLSAGIAHEINTPIQFIGDNCKFLEISFGELLSFFESIESGRIPISEELRLRLEALDIDYLKEEIPKAIEQSRDGVARVSKIVSAMKDFSHPSTDCREAIEINRAIESTVTVSRNEWKHLADLEMDLDPALPLVPCYPGEFNQVILNLIVNAAHAIEEVRRGREPAPMGRICIRTRQKDDLVEIRISDTGSGIPEAIRGRIFDPFFTTKPVGKGTGQGLSIAHAVIVDKHGGRISLESEEGEGSAFILELPLREGGIL